MDYADMEQRLRAKLMAMSKEEIIDFMKKKGNTRKKALFDEMVFQTQDSEHTIEFVETYDKVVKEKSEKLKEINSGVNHFGKIEEECESTIADINGQKAEVEKKQAMASDGIENLQKRLPDLALKITPQLITAMNKVYNETTPSWTEPVEHFVGLLRNV